MSVTQSKHKVWNLWDEHAALMSLVRLPGETNDELKTRISNIGKFREGVTRQGLVNALSSALGYEQYNTVVRRVFTLTHNPYRTSSFTVIVDDVTQTQVSESSYSTATTGYVVWTDENGEYTRLLEFFDPPSFSRKGTNRKHNGVYVKVTYSYEDGDRIRTITDQCNIYDTEDELFMGWNVEPEGTIKVHALSDETWLDNISHGFKYIDGTPTPKLEAIWKEVDAATPSSWGP